MTGKIDIKTGFRAALVSAALVAAFALPAQAMAAQGDCVNAGADPTAAQYCSVSGAQTGGGNNTPAAQSEPQGESGSSEPAPEPAPAETSGTAAVESSGSSGSLPFTGLDVGILFLVAAVLVGTGLALRRLTASGAKHG